MHPSKSAYTLPEVLFTVTSIALTAVGLLVGLANLNEFAMRNRLNTLATAIVEDQIGRALRETPFNPPTSIPPALVSNTTTQAVYTDPTSGRTIVTGTLAVTVAPVSAPITSGSGSASVTVYQVQASLNYHFHNKNYSAQMAALRSIDASVN